MSFFCVVYILLAKVSFDICTMMCLSKYLELPAPLPKLRNVRIPQMARQNQNPSCGKLDDASTRNVVKTRHQPGGTRNSKR